MRVLTGKEEWIMAHGSYYIQALLQTLDCSGKCAGDQEVILYILLVFKIKTLRW